MKLPNQPPQMNVLFPPTTGPQAQAVAKYLMTNPVVNGAVIAVNWSDCDKGNGQYDFTIPDAALAPWRAAHKTVNLVIWAVSDSASGAVGNASTPPYVWSLLGPSNYVTVQTQAGEQRIPNYLALAWSAAYKAFIAAVYKHYHGTVGLGYIRVGLGHGGETIPAAGWQNVPQFAKWGLTIQTWEAYLLTMLEYESSLKGLQWMVGITPMGQNGTQVPDFVAASAAPLGIGFGSQGLEASDIAAAKAGKPTTADWLALFKKWPSVPHELQTIGLSCPSGSCAGNVNAQATGPLPPLLAFGKANGCNIFEIYCDDWLLAFDPTYPGYAQYGEAYAKAIQQTAV
jgi:hypothetical protein